MLVLTRRTGEIVDIGEIAITVTDISDHGISLNLQCPADTKLQIQQWAQQASRDINHDGKVAIRLTPDASLLINTTIQLKPVSHAPGKCQTRGKGRKSIPLGFIAPGDVRIWRRELTLRGAA